MLCLFLLARSKHVDKLCHGPLKDFSFSLQKVNFLQIFEK